MDNLDAQQNLVDMTSKKIPTARKNSRISTIRKFVGEMLYIL